MKKLDISEMKLPPELRQEETVLAVVKGFVQVAHQEIIKSL